MKKDDFQFYSQNITAIAVDRYLVQNAWMRDLDFPNKNLMVYKKNLLSISIPSDESFADFRYVLQGVIKTIAMVDEKEAGDIINELCSYNQDRLMFRILSPITVDGKLPMSYAQNCIEGIHDLILYAACAEQNPEPVCPRATKGAHDMLKKFKMAQTDIGSYIINIDLEVINTDNQLHGQTAMQNVQPPISISHMVVERINTAIQQVDSATQPNIYLSDVARSAYEKGITANMCDALLKMKGDNSTEIRTLITYSPIVGRDNPIKKEITLGERHFMVIDELSKIYRNTINTKDIEIRGMVKSAKYKAVDDLREASLVTFFNGEYRTVSFSLQKKDFKTACDALKNSLEVEVSGVLDMSKRFWEMTEINYFRVVEGEDQV